MRFATDSRWRAASAFFQRDFSAAGMNSRLARRFTGEGSSVGLRDSPAGNYTLIYDRVNNVSGAPVEIAMLNSPTEPKPRTNYYAG